MSINGKFIFIVEDNLQNRVIYQIIMVRNGAWVEFDRWGRDTLSNMKKLPKVDLIILDLMLPSGDSGYEIYKQIRELPEYDKVPIVAVSAAEPAVSISKARAMGFSGFIAKPINDDLFPDQLAHIMSGKKVWYAGDHYDGPGLSRRTP